jgi:hypothetical protein
VRAQKYQPDKPLGRGERVITFGTCPLLKQKVGQHFVFVGFAEIQRFSVGQKGDGPADSIWDVQYLDCSLDFGHRDLMLLNLLIKRAARDPKTLRGLLNATTLLMKHSLDVLFFEFQKRQMGIEKGCA